MTNPFDDDNGSFLVLTNDEGQHSLWPTTIDVPSGWNINFGPEGRNNCLKQIEQTWLDMRPKTLVVAMSGKTQN